MLIPASAKIILYGLRDLRFVPAIKVLVLLLHYLKILVYFVLITPIPRSKMHAYWEILQFSLLYLAFTSLIAVLCIMQLQEMELMGALASLVILGMRLSESVFALKV
jgi:hypothetical protein